MQHFRFLNNFFIQYFLAVVRVLDNSCLVGKALSRAVTQVKRLRVIHISLRGEKKALTLLLKLNVLLHRHRFRTLSNCNFFNSHWVKYLSPKVDDLAAWTGKGSQCSGLLDALIVFDCIYVDLPPNFCVDFG